MEFSSLKEYSFRTLIKYWLLAILGILMFFFVLFQARFLIMGPQITLTESPKTPGNERYIEIKGTAYNISRIWLNDRPIFTDAQGNFKEAIVLENGYTIATLRAEDRYGRTTNVTREMVYVPQSRTPESI
jgi:hypothetical protein